MTTALQATILITTLLLLPSLKGQTIQASTPQGRSLRTLFFQRPAEFPESAVLCQATSCIEIALPPLNLSAPIKLATGDQVFAILPQAPAKGDPIPQGAPLVSIPGAWKRVILLVFPDPKNKIFPIQVKAVNASLDRFPPGQLLFFNLSTAEVMGTLGDVKLRLASGKSAIVKPPREESGDFTVAIDYVLPGDSEPRPLCRTSWRHNPDVRQMLFIVNPNDRLAPRIWAIPETISAVEN